MALILGGIAAGKAIKDIVDKATGGKISNAVNSAVNSGSAGKSTGSPVSGVKDTSDGGGSSGVSTGSASGQTSPTNGYTTKYTGGDTQLDAKLADLGQKYNAARDRALAGDKSAVSEMRNLNDWANQARNAAGFAAEYAEDDLSKVKGQIGYYDEPSGGGFGSSEPSGSGTGTGGVNDYSDYIEDMNRAKQEAALADLRAAFEKNMSAIDSAGGKLAPTYQAARNQAAGNAAREQQSFNEYAAAYGLNSGTSGQAHLAMSNALQGSLSGIDTAEADALSDLELQRSQTEIDYNNAIAKAKAEGNYQLAEQLYAEKVRVDEAIRAQIAQAAQDELTRQQLATQQNQQQWENDFATDKYNTSLKQQDYNNMLALAQEMAAYGDFSGYQALGIDTSTMEQRYAQELAAANTKTYSSGNSGGSSGMSLSTAEKMANAGEFNDAVLAAFHKAGYSDAYLASVYGYKPASDTGPADTGLTVDTASVAALGFGPLDAAALANLEAQGVIESYTEGNKIKFRRKGMPASVWTDTKKPFEMG